MGRNRRISTVLITDGNLLFRRGLRTLLSKEGDMQVIEEASDAPEALAKSRLLNPDVILMDVQLASGEGKQACIAIRQAQPNVSILFLAQSDTPEELEIAVEAGARAFMLKSSSPAAIVAGIRQMALLEDQTAKGLSKIVPDLRALAASNESFSRGSALTPREQEVTRLLAEGRTVREVANELALSVKTVEAHKLNLMRKLDIHNRASLVEYALQKGIITPEAVR